MVCYLGLWHLKPGESGGLPDKSFCHNNVGSCIDSIAEVEKGTT